MESPEATARQPVSIGPLASQSEQSVELAGQTQVKKSGKCCLCSSTMGKLATLVAAVACVVGILALPAVGVITIIPASAALAMIAIGGVGAFVGFVTACIRCCKGNSIEEVKDELTGQQAEEALKAAQ